MKSIGLLAVFGLLWLGCEPVSKQEGTDTKRVPASVSSLVNLTPPSDALPPVNLMPLEQSLRNGFASPSKLDTKDAACGESLLITIEPTLFFGFDTNERGKVPTSEWSAAVSIADKVTGINSRVELSWLADGRSSEVSLQGHLAKSVEAFTLHLKNSLSILSLPAAQLVPILLDGSLGEKKVLVERLSMCPLPEIDAHLGAALAKTNDSTLRFRLIGLIGERRVSAVGDQLIDLIDLNDIEWTRTIVRTLSTLQHPRTHELLQILSVHESPALKKEIKGAVDRLERRGKIP